MSKKKDKKIYFTITGMNYFQGQSFLKPGMKVQIEKEPDNKFDKEAILVSMEGVGAIYSDQLIIPIFFYNPCCK